MSSPLRIIIPGLAMAAHEFPRDANTLVLENPEIGDGISLPAERYTLEDVASSHAKTIAGLNNAGKSISHVIGFSMGGAIAAILGSEHRELFSEDVTFGFLATTANTSTNPAVSAELAASMQKARPGDVASFAESLQLLFSPAYFQSERAKLEEYFTYRAFGKNRQSARGYFRQLQALMQFSGATYFPQFVGRRVFFAAGSDDRIFAAPHRADLQNLLPEAPWQIFPGVGHMLNVERPEAFFL